MRTTITIDDDLYLRAKEHAARTDRTVSALIEDAVRDALGPSKKADSELKPLPVSGGSGLMPGVDLSDSARLLGLMEAEETLDARHPLD